MGKLSLPFRALTAAEFGGLSVDEKIAYLIRAVELLEPATFNRMMESFGVGAYYSSDRGSKPLKSA